jgi:tRNA pseudouridine55 synthase
MSSNFALQKVKRLFKAKKAGYVGTLDPFATGMLPICFGKATKLVERLHEEPKSYRAHLRLGVSTTTGDTEGEYIDEKPIPTFNLDDLNKILQKFTGDIMQVPPMYSAIKHQGQPLYKLARMGQTIERPARPAKIYELKIISYTPSEIVFEAVCGKGVYIRTLGEDIANALNTSGHLVALRRLYCAGFKESELLTFNSIEGDANNDFTTLTKHLKQLDIKPIGV